MTRPYYVIEITPGQYHVRAGETTDDVQMARQYATLKGARGGLGLARMWDMLLDAKVVGMTPRDATDATDAEPSR